MKLSSAQEKKLRGFANPLKPIIFIGKEGFSESVKDAMDEALTKHELVKVKFNEFKTEKKALSAEIAKACACHWVGLIGNVGLFFRQNPDVEKRKYHLT